MPRRSGSRKSRTSRKGSRSKARSRRARTSRRSSRKTTSRRRNSRSKARSRKTVSRRSTRRRRRTQRGGGENKTRLEIKKNVIDWLKPKVDAEVTRMSKHTKFFNDERKKKFDPTYLIKYFKNIIDVFYNSKIKVENLISNVNDGAVGKDAKNIKKQLDLFIENAWKVKDIQKEVYDKVN